MKAPCLPVASHLERQERQFCQYLRGRVDALIEARTMEGPVACGLPTVHNVVRDGRGQGEKGVGCEYGFLGLSM